MEQTTQKKSKSKTILTIASVIVVIIAGGIFYWLKNAGYETTDNAQIDGNIESIRSSVTAYIEEIKFQDNQIVKQGDTLIVFNTNVLAAKAKQAEAALENAKAGLNVTITKSQSSLQNVQASLKNTLSDRQNIIAAKANLDKAQQDFDRVNELLKIKAATQEQYESTLNLLQVAKANYNRAINTQQASVSSTEGQKINAKAEGNQILVSQSLIKQREAELIIAKEDLDHAYVIAPFDGIVTKRTVQQGQYISNGQTLCALVDIKHVWVSANFKETQLQNILPGQKVEITVDAFSKLKLHGTVASFAGATGAKFSLLPPDNATGNFIKISQRFPVKIAIDHFFIEKNKPTVLYPGLSVFVKVNTH